MSWCRGPCGSHDEMFVTVCRLPSCLCRAPSLTRGRVVCQSESAVFSRFSVYTYIKVCTFHIFNIHSHVYILYLRPQDSNLDIWMAVHVTAAKFKTLTFSVWGSALSNIANTVNSQSESELHYNWRSVSQYVLVSSPIWDFCLEIFFFFESHCSVIWGCPLWRRSGQSVVSLFSI
jgi:hypothetical protein